MECAHCVVCLFLNLCFFSFFTLSFPFSFMLSVFVMDLILFLQLNSVYMATKRLASFMVLDDLCPRYLCLLPHWLCHQYTIVVNHPCTCKMQGIQCTATALVLMSFSRCSCVMPSHVDVQRDALLKSVQFFTLPLHLQIYSEHRIVFALFLGSGQVQGLLGHIK